MPDSWRAPYGLCRPVPYRTVNQVDIGRQSEMGSFFVRASYMAIERLTGAGDFGGSPLRRRWMLLVAIVVVAVAGFAVYRLHGIFGSRS